MPTWICVTCGVQHADTEAPPPRCPICEDERQYVGPGGQRWTTHPQLAADHANELEEHEPGLTSFRTTPGFAIGQRAYLVQTSAGNLLWDCLSVVDDATVAEVRQRGGLAAIAVSHPHFYASCIEWSHALGGGGAGVPVYLHADDRAHVMRPDPAVVAWEGDEAEPVPGLTLLRLGGHFDGATVMLWPAGADGHGVLLTGDTIHVVADARFVSAMYSYPNFIPLSSAEVGAIVERLSRHRFDRIYGSLGGVVDVGATEAVRRSFDRYVARLGEGEP